MGYLITSSFKLASYQDAMLQSDLTIYSRSLLDLAHADRSRAMILQNFAVRSSLSKYELNYPFVRRDIVHASKGAWLRL